MGSSYNDISTFKEQLGRKVRKYDYLAFDDGSRNLPMGQVKTLLQLSSENGGNAQTNPGIIRTIKNYFKMTISQLTGQNPIRNSVSNFRRNLF